MKLIKVPCIDQTDRYPTGCESVSAVMLLQYLGVDLSVDEFIETYLPQEPMTVRQGSLYGPDPRKVFCGSPYDSDSYGCYSPVIRQAVERALGDARPTDAAEPEYEVIDETGAGMEHLLRTYLDHDMPVIFWVCIDMKEPIIGPSWTLTDTGELFTWISNEHCMLLVGYDDTGYWFNDPWNHHGLIHYEKNLTEARHRAQYGMAVGVWEK